MPAMPLQIIFMGTAELANASLLALNQRPDFRVAAVVTQPDRPGGRHLQPRPSPVKTIALAEKLPVLQPERARDPEFLRELQRWQPDLIVVAAYGQLLPPAILQLPRHGCLNVHTSLLPKYRGASPIQSALLNDDSETGVTIMQMDAGLDTGPLLAQAATPIGADDNAETLHDRLAQLGAALLVQTIPGFVAGQITPRPQPAAGVSHATKIGKQDGRLDWQLPARQLWNRIRAFTPWPGAFTHWRKGGTPGEQPRFLKIWRAETLERSGSPGEILQADKAGIVIACGRDALRVVTLQLEGGKRLSAAEFLSGHGLKAGHKLG
jgi:methionyl-tRNA formyltransferase